jgi:hypothetical protein
LSVVSCNFWEVLNPIVSVSGGGKKEMAEGWTYELFVSYAEADRAWVEGYLLDALEKAEVRCTRESAFTLGVPRILEFERAIRQSRYTLLVISEAYLADDLTRFTDILAQSYGEQVGTWPVIPLILQAGLQLPPRLKMLESLPASSSEQWETALERLCRQLKHPLPPPSPKPACPYPGTIAFSEDDKRRFFGRDGEIEELLGRLRLHPFIAAIGPSGSGKSSLVFAGLIPQLKRSGLFGTGEWCVRSLRPGSSPLANLQDVLGGDLNALETTIGQLLSTQPDARRLLLAIDQFEELFALGSAEAIPFQQAILKLMEISNIYLILTVRADFYPDLMESLLWEKMRSHRFEVLPLDERGLKQAIVKPAEGVEVYVDSALVERLVVDAKGEPGVLPLVQETLVLLWEKLERHYLPLKAYELLVLPRPAYGATATQPRTGLQVAIARRADATLANLETPEKQAIAQRIFLRLIQFGEGRPDTRRQQLQRDLRSAADDAELFDRTIKHLADDRLLTFSGEENARDRLDRKVDLAHEALIAGWPTLQQWIAARREAEWVRLGLGIGGLLDSVELAEAERWLTSSDAEELGYGEKLTELVSASRAEIDRAEKEKAKRQKIQRIWILSAASVILLAVVVFTAFEFVRRANQLVALYDRWSGLTKGKSVEDSVQFLKNAENRAKQAEDREQIDRAIAYYRQIHAETALLLYEEGNIALLKRVSNSLDKNDICKLSKQEAICQLFQRSEKSLSLLIIDHKIKYLEQALTKESNNRKFLGIIPPDADRQSGKGEKQFPDGSALQITYKILMTDYGVHADFNRNGGIDDGKEAYQIPSEVLAEIDRLWQEKTKQPCGWYDPEQLKEVAKLPNISEERYQLDPPFHSSLKCQVFQKQTLFKQIFDESAIAVDRIYESPFVQKDL